MGQLHNTIGSNLVYFRFDHTPTSQIRISTFHSGTQFIAISADTATAIGDLFEHNSGSARATDFLCHRIAGRLLSLDS